MHGLLLNLAVIGYICATGLALAHLVQRQELIHRLASLATLAGWACHTLALVVRAVELGRPPLGTLGEAVSVAAWVVVLIEMIAERQTGVRVLGAFVLPVVLILSVKANATPAASLEPALGKTWIWVHIALALIGIAAFVLNFAGAVMYLLQERQLKARRPGGAHRLGQSLRLRPARALLVRRVGDLRGDARRACRRRLARPARRVLRRPRLRRSGPHAGRRPVPAGQARLLMTLFVAGLSHKNTP